MKKAFKLLKRIEQSESRQFIESTDTAIDRYNSNNNR